MIIEHGVSIIAHSYIIIEVKLHWKKIRELEKLVLYNTILPVHFTGFNRLHGDKKIPLFLIWWAVGERVLYSLVNWAVPESCLWFNIFHCSVWFTLRSSFTPLQCFSKWLLRYLSYLVSTYISGVLLIRFFDKNNHKNVAQEYHCNGYNNHDISCICKSLELYQHLIKVDGIGSYKETTSEGGQVITWTVQKSI